MFSLIISIIAIALVAVLAVATVWYGTDIYEEQLIEAGAAQIISETEQIEGAILAYNVEKGVPPVINECDPADTTCEPLQSLIDAEYLTTAPVGNADGDEQWAMAVIYSDGTADNDVSALVKTVPQEECKRANEMMEFMGVADYNTAQTDDDLDLKHAKDSLGADLKDEEGNLEQMIPQCASVMPSSVVCCQTVATP